MEWALEDPRWLFNAALFRTRKTMHGCRSGVLVCEPVVGDLRIFGVFQWNDTDKILSVRQKPLPIVVVCRIAYGHRDTALSLLVRELDSGT